jgi:hypothetical protein
MDFCMEVRNCPLAPPGHIQAPLHIEAVNREGRAMKIAWPSALVREWWEA